MKKDNVSRLLILNFLFFPFLWIVTLTLIGIESFTYPGFVFKHLLISINLLIVLVMVSALLARLTTLSQHIPIRMENLYKLLFEINLLVFPSLIVLTYLVFRLKPIWSNSVLYTNKLRFYPGTFALIPLLSFLLIYLQVLDIKSFSFRKTIPKFLTGVLIIWIIFFSVDNSWKFFKSNIKSPIKAPFLSFSQKMDLQVGPIFDYYNFINTVTPNNALIMHPKQQSQWGDISNEGYTRYFLYPRNLISEDSSTLDKSKVDYVVIIGHQKLNGGEQNGWPNFIVPASKIIFYPNNPEGKLIIINNQKFNPSKNPYPNYWGIIKVEKGVQW